MRLTLKLELNGGRFWGKTGMCGGSVLCLFVLVVIFCVFFFQWLYLVTENYYEEDLRGGGGLSRVLKTLACLRKPTWLLSYICCDTHLNGIIHESAYDASLSPVYGQYTSSVWHGKDYHMCLLQIDSFFCSFGPIRTLAHKLEYLKCLKARLCSLSLQR